RSVPRARACPRGLRPWRPRPRCAPPAAARASRSALDATHLLGERRLRVRPLARERVDDALAHLGRLVLADLAARVEARHADAQSDRALRDAPRVLLVARERAWFGHRMLEVVGEALEHAVVLLLAEDLGYPVQVRR